MPSPYELKTRWLEWPKERNAPVSTKEYREIMADLIERAEEALGREDKEAYDDCLWAIRKVTIAWDPENQNKEDK